MNTSPVARDRSASDALVAAFLAKGGQITHCAPRAARGRTTRLVVAKRTTRPNGRTVTVLKRAGHASHTSFRPVVFVRNSEELARVVPTLQRGQWVNMNGIRGRMVGEGQSLWFAWGSSARDAARFSKMCNAFASVAA